jgi:hypothetical protein
MKNPHLLSCEKNQFSLGKKQVGSRSVVSAIRFLLSLLFFLGLSARIFSQVDGDYQTRASGNWNDNNSWQVRSAGAWVNCLAGDYPGASASAGTVNILSSHALTLNISPANPIGALTFAPGNIALASLTFNSNWVLNITGAVTYTLPGANNNGDQTLSVGTGTLNCASITMITTTNNARIHTLSIGAGTVNVSGSVTMATAIQNAITFTGSGLLNIGGDFTSGTGTFTPSTGTVSYNGSSQTVAGLTYSNLTLDGSGDKTMQGNVTVNANASFTAGSLVLNGNILNLNNSTTLSGGTITGSATSSLSISGTNTPAMSLPQISGGLLNFTLNKTGTGNSVTLGGDLTVAGAATFTSGQLNSAYNIDFNGTTVCGAGSVNASLGTVTYNSAVAQNLIAGTYSNLIKAGANIATLCNSIAVNGNLTVSAGTISYGGVLRTITVGGDLSGAGTIDMSGGSLDHVLILDGEFNSIGTLTTAASSSVVIYNRAGNQNIFSSPNYRSLTIANGGNKTLQGNITIGATATFTSGSMVLNGSTLNLANSVSVASGTITGGSTSGISISGNNTPSMSLPSISGGLLNFTINKTGTNNTVDLGSVLELDAAGTFSFTAGRLNSAYDISINGATVCGAGVMNATEGTVLFNSPVAQNVFAGTYNNITKSGAGTATLCNAITINGNLLISSGLLDVNAANHQITLRGNWTDANGVDGFVQRSGSVVLNGSTIQTISQPVGETFHNLTINNPSGIRLSDGNITVGNVLTMLNGNVDANSHVLAISNSSTAALVQNTGQLYNGILRRAVNVVGSYLFPVGTNNYDNSCIIGFTGIAPTGNLDIQFITADPGPAGLPLSESGLNINSQYTDGYWSVKSSTGYASTYEITLNTEGFTSYTVEQSTRILKRTNAGNWTLSGVHSLQTPPTLKRTGLSGIDTGVNTTIFGLGKTDCITITANPSDVTTCSGQNATFSVTASGTGLSYRWQKNGVDLTDGGKYSNTGTSSMTVTGIASSETGLYRCKITSTCLGSPLAYTSNASLSISSPFPSLGYEFYRTITIDQSMVPGTSDLNNFPVLISGTYPYLMSVTNGGQVHSVNGYDIAFTDNDGFKLDHQIESYNPLTGEFIAWVRMPVLYTYKNTTFRMLYGNPQVVANPSVFTVFNSDYRGVWHLNDQTSIIDQTGSGNNGTNFGTGGASNITGRIGGALDFESSEGDYISIANEANFDLTSAITVSMWVKVESFSIAWQAMLTKGDNSWRMQRNNSANEVVLHINGASNLNGTKNINDGNWHYIVGTHNGAVQNIYVDGVLDATVNNAGTFNTNNLAVNIGNNSTYGNRYFDGIIDEARVLSVARSASWVKTEYINQSNPSLFYSIGSESPNSNYDDFAACENTLQTYSVPATPGHTYTWSVTGGTFAPTTGNSVDITWGGVGAGTIQLTENSGSCSGTSIIYNVNIASSPAPVITGNNDVCLNASGEVYSTPAVGGNSYQWTVTGGTIDGSDTGNSIIVDWGVSGPGSVKVEETIIATGCSVTTADFVVQIRDVVAPVLSDCPSNINVSADAGSCSAIVSWTEPTATDNCTASGSLIWNKSHTPGTAFPVGVTTVTYTAQDALGNISTPCSFTVTVTDDELPVIIAPAPVSVSTDPGLCTASGVALGVPVTSDNCSVANVTNDAPATFPIGLTTVTWTVTDDDGNSATATQDVTVADNEIPVALCQNISVTRDQFGNATIVPADINNGSYDNCGIATLSLDKSSFTNADISPVLVTLTVTDVNGNSATCTSNVTLITTVFYSFQTGNWDQATTWTTDPSGLTGPGSSVPGNGAEVVILSGRTVSLTSNVVETGIDLTINSGATLDLSTFRFTNTLTELNGAGILKLNSPDFPSATVNTFISGGGGTTEYNNNGSMSATQLAYNNLIIRSAGTVTSVGDIQLNGNLSILLGSLADGGNTITVNGNVTNNGTHSGAGKIYLNGGSGVHAISGSTNNFGNLELDDSNGATFTGSGTTNVAGNLTVTAGTLTIGAFTNLAVGGSTSVGTGATAGGIVINSTTGTKVFSGLLDVGTNGTWTNPVNEAVTFHGGITNDGSFTAGTGVHTFNTSSQDLNGIFSIPNITVTGVTITNNNSLTVGTALSGTGALTQASGAILTIGGGSTIAAIDASVDPNTVNYTSGGAQTVKGTSYHNLNLSGGGAKTLGAAMAVNGNLAVSGTATLTDAGYQITGNSTGTFTLGAGTFLTLGNALAATAFPTGFTSVNTSLSNTSTVTYNSNFAQIISAVAAYGNLVLNSGAPVTKTADNNLTVNGTLTISANSTLADGGYTIDCLGTITVAGAHTGTGKIRATSGVAQNIGGAGSLNNLEIAKSAGNAQLTTSFSINGNILVTSGGFTMNGQTLTTGGDINIASGATMTVNNNAILRVANGKVITNAGTFTFVGGAGSPATITRNGAGTFTFIQNAATGTFNGNYFALDYGNITISNGAITTLNNGSFSNGTGFNEYLNLDDFANNISSSLLTFNAGPTYNIRKTSGAGIITLTGASGALAGENFDQDDSDPGTLILWTSGSIFYSQGTGLFSTLTNWDTNPAGGGMDPVIGDFTSGLATFIVRDGHTITVDRALDIYDLTVGEGASGTLTIGNSITARTVTVRNQMAVLAGATANVGAFTTAHTLTLYKDLAINGTFDMHTAAGQVCNVVFTGAGSPDHAIGGTPTTVQFNSITLAAGSNSTVAGYTLDIQGNMLLSAATTFDGGGFTHTVMGNWTGNATGNHISDDRIVFGGSTQLIAGPASFYDIEFTGAGTKTMGSGAINVNNNLLITGSNVILAPSVAVNIAGNLNVSGTPSVIGGTAVNITTITGNLNVTNNSVLTLGSAAAAKTINVSGNIQVDAGSTMNVGNFAALHNILLAGNMIVDGSFDMFAAVGRACNVTFTGATDNTITGTGATCNFNAITVNKGTGVANIIDVQRPITMSSPTISSNYLILTNGTFKMSSASTINPYFGGHTIVSATGRLWLNNAGATIGDVLNQGITGTVTGTLQIDAGTFKWGGQANSYIQTGSPTSTINITGADALLNVSGGLYLRTGAKFNMTNGNVILDAQSAANLNPAYDIFNITSDASNNISITGGTITITDPHAVSGGGQAMNITTAAGTYNFTGSTFSLGDGVSTSAGSVDGFDINLGTNIASGNIIVNNTATNAATRFVRITGASAIGGNLTITNTGGSDFRLNNNNLNLSGDLINNGTFTSSGGANSILSMVGTAQQTISGTGAFTDGNAGRLFKLTVNNTSGSNPAVVLQLPVIMGTTGSILNLTTGSLDSGGTGALTLGIGAASTLTINRTDGSLLLTPTWNLAGVTLNINYNPTAGVVNTGNELPASANGDISTLTINNAPGVVMNASDIKISNTLILQAGEFNIQNNTLRFHTGGAPISRNGGTQTGTLTTGPNASLFFGLPGFTGGGNFGFPNGTFTATPAVMGDFTIERTNYLVLSNQGLTLNGTLSFNNAGSLYLQGNTLTFQNDDEPILRPSTGTIMNSVGTPSLVFGTPGNNGGNAFQIPNGVFGSTVFNSITINRDNELTWNAQNFSLTGPLTLTSGEFDLNGVTLTTNAPIPFVRTAGTLTPSAGSLSFTANAAPFTFPDNLFTAAPAILTNLSLSRGAGVLMTLGNQEFRVTGTTTLTAGTGGILEIMDSDLQIASTVGTPSANSMIVMTGTGFLKRSFPAGASPAFTFPVGDITGTVEYSPAAITFTANSAPKVLGIRVIDAIHPSDGGSSDNISRYWSFKEDPTGGTYIYNASFTYVAPADLTGAHANLRVNRWDGSSWTQYTTTGASPVITASGMTETSSPFNSSEFTGRVLGPVTYYWNQSGAIASWANPFNWTPARLSPQPTDILIFDNNGVTTATNVPSQTIERLTILNGSQVTLTATAASTLIINDIAGTELDVTSGSSLTAGTNLNITLSASATASISGTLTVGAGSTYTTNGVSAVTNVTGSLVNSGTVNGTVTGLLFTAGSVYDHSRDGGTVPTATWDVASNCNITGLTAAVPAGLTQTFGNFNYNSSYVMLLGGNLTVAGNLDISSGAINGGTRTINLTGNLTGTDGLILSSGRLNIGGDYTNTGTFTAGTGFVDYSGANQQVKGATYSNLIISGSGVKALNGPAAVNATVTLTSGILQLGDHDLTLNNITAIAGAPFSATKLIETNGNGYLIRSGNIANQSFNSVLYPVGSGGFYNPFTVTGLPAIGAATRSLAVKAVPVNPAVLSNSLNKYWDIVSTNITTSGVTVLSFTYNAGEVVGDPLLFQPYTNTSGSWSLATGPSAPGSNPATSTGTATPITGHWTVGSPSTFYSYQSGSWDQATTWTFDPGGSTGPGTMVPGNSDKVVILSGRTVSLQSDNFTSNLDITINNGGFLDQQTFRFTNTLAALSGDGTLKLASSNFPVATSNSFVSSDGGTTEYNHIGNMSSVQAVYYHLSVNSSGIVTQVSDVTLNGDLTVKQGTFRINDATAQRLKLIINGNVTVDNTGIISVGTGGTNSQLSPLGITGNTGSFLNYYELQTHRVQVYGNFTNNGTVKFSNLNYPVYNQLSTTGAATVYFQGAADRTLICNGLTEFYNLVVDKGTDQTFRLAIQSSAYSNFRLFGANTAYGSTTLPAATFANPNLNKALWIKNGTLVLQGLVAIPSLSEGITAPAGSNISSDFFIPLNGALLLDGVGVIVLSTADDYTEVNAAYGLAGGSNADYGISATGGYSGLSVLGKFQVNNGYLSTRESSGLHYWSYASGQFILNNGKVDTKQFHNPEGGATGLVSYSQSGGNLIVRGRFTNNINYTNPADLSNASINTARENSGIDTGAGIGAFSLNSNAANGFSMSGGTLSIHDVTNTTATPIAFLVNCPVSNINVTGGTLQILPTTGTVLADANYLINTTGPVYNFTINQISGASEVHLDVNQLVVQNNLTLTSGVLNANNLDVTIGGNFTIAAGTTYTTGTNTTVFNGAADQTFSISTAAPQST